MSNYIKEIQRELKNAGFYTDEVDGIAGKNTVSAVKSAIASDKVDLKPYPATGQYHLSDLSNSRLSKIHPDLQKVVQRAINISDTDFIVGEGIRTIERQRELYNKGASKTMNSRHLTGHAVDLIALDEAGVVSWDWEYYYSIEVAMKQAAKDVGVTIEWGGDWKTFKDGPHYQLPWSSYPK